MVTESMQQGIQTVNWSCDTAAACTLWFATLPFYYCGQILHMILSRHWIRGSNCRPCSYGVATYEYIQ